MDGLINNNEGYFQVNVPNHGALPGIPDDVVVEVPAIVNQKGIQPLRVGSLPPKIMLECILPDWLDMERELLAFKTGDRSMQLFEMLSNHQTRDLRCGRGPAGRADPPARGRQRSKPGSRWSGFRTPTRTPRQSQLAANMRLAALLFDLGDTIMVEETEVKDTEGTTLRAELAPGMAEVLRDFKAMGHRLALVADSRPHTPENVLRQHGLFESVRNVGHLGGCWRQQARSETLPRRTGCAGHPGEGLRPRGHGGQQSGAGHRRGQPARPDLDFLSPERPAADESGCDR